MTLRLAPIPATAGKDQVSCRQEKARLGPPIRGGNVKMTAKQLTQCNGDPLAVAFHKWLAGREPSKRKAAEFLRLIKHP